MNATVPSGSFTQATAALVVRVPPPQRSRGVQQRLPAPVARSLRPAGRRPIPCRARPPSTSTILSRARAASPCASCACCAAPALWWAPPCCGSPCRARSTAIRARARCCSATAARPTSRHRRKPTQTRSPTQVSLNTQSFPRACKADGGAPRRRQRTSVGARRVQHPHRHIVCCSRQRVARQHRPDLAARSGAAAAPWNSVKLGRA
jgi:hypothetical protein